MKANHLLQLALLSILFSCGRSHEQAQATQYTSQTPPPSIEEQELTTGPIDHPGHQIFEYNCVACHNPNYDAYPNLIGIADRRDKEWAQRFIQNPTQLYDNGDPQAIHVINEWKPKVGVMSNFEHFSEEEMEILLSYLGY